MMWKRGNGLLGFGFAAIGLALCSGCISTGPWRDSLEAAVMAGGQIAKAVERSYTNSWPHPLMDDPMIERGWAGANGRIYLALNVASCVDKFIQQTDVYRTWPGTQSYFNSLEQRLAPFTLTLVSLDPIVVIMQPHDYGSPVNRSTYDIVGWREHALFLQGLMNYLYYGTQLSKSAETWWFSPDLKQPPVRLVMKEGEAALTIPGTGLRLVRVPEGWCAEPLAR